MESELWWRLGAVANTVIAISYVGIAATILAALLRTRQLHSNRLATATAAIFVTCAVHHGHHVVHLVSPALGFASTEGEALRSAFDWHWSVWDLVGAVVAVHYWSLRRAYGGLVHGAKLFDDLRERQRQALELNDNVVQGLVAAQLALTLDEEEMAADAVTDTLAKARGIITDLLGEQGSEIQLGAGDLVRNQAARAADAGGDPASEGRVSEGRVSEGRASEDENGGRHRGHDGGRARAANGAR